MLAAKPTGPAPSWTHSCHQVWKPLGTPTGQAVASGGYVLYVQAEGEGTTMHVMRRKLGVVR